MSSHQDFTPEQLERIESAVNLAITSNHDPRTPGTVVKDILRNQDLTNARSRPITSVNNSPPIGFLQLPAEIRNMIYRYCLVVGEVYPRPKPHDDDRLNDRANFQQPQTQVFQLCRQIFAEAAPLCFAENKFVLSYGRLPWSYSTEDLGSRPVSRVAHQNLRSLSVTFDIRDCYTPPSILETRCSHIRGPSCVFEKWRNLARLLSLLDLQMLEVSLENSYCAFCHGRFVHRAMQDLIENIRCSPRVILRGLIDNYEVYLARSSIGIRSVLSFDSNGHSWRAEYDRESKDDKFEVALRVIRNPETAQ
jgi:hypothetical protein